MRAGNARRRIGGFTYLGVLFLVMLLGLGLAGTAQTWSMASQRAHERELLWVGNQYARALQSYFQQTPGQRQYPVQLQDLVEDRRFPDTLHHLRKLYPDPVSGQPFKVVLAPDGRTIAGVRSPSDAAPIKRDNFPARWRQFKGSKHYSDWLFTADGAGTGAAAASTTLAPAVPAARR